MQEIGKEFASRMLIEMADMLPQLREAKVTNYSVDNYVYAGNTRKVYLSMLDGTQVTISITTPATKGL